MGPLLLAGAMAGMSLLQSIDQDQQSKLANIKAKSDAKVANILRIADNQMQAAKDSLARYQQSQSNKYKLLSGGQELDAQRTNLLRMADDSVRGSFERRIQVAEEAGALAASAGAAGVGGGSLAMVEQQQVLRSQRMEEAARIQKEQMEFDGELAMDQTQQAMVLGLDDVQINTSLNFMETQPQLQPRVNWTSALLKAGAQGAQSYFMMGGKMPSFGGGATSGGLQQSVAGGPMQSAAVSTSPFGNRPAPTLRMK